jgi:hypothetical protein
MEIKYAVFFLPLPLGLGCVSIIAAYSGSRAFCVDSQNNASIVLSERAHLEVNEVLEQVRLT